MTLCNHATDMKDPVASASKSCLIRDVGMDFRKVPKIEIGEEKPRGDVDPGFGPNPPQGHRLEQGVDLQEVQQEEEKVPKQQ